MIMLQYLHNGKWANCGEFVSEHVAWISLGGDDFNYRTVDMESMDVLTDKSQPHTGSSTEGQEN